MSVASDVPSRVTVMVNDGVSSSALRFFDYTNSHVIPLAGFKPRRTNSLSVVLTDKRGVSVTNANNVIFFSPALPAEFPPLVLLTNQPDRMEPGYTLFRLVNNDLNRAYITIVDHDGEVVWYSPNTTVLDVRQLTNGNIFIPLVTNFLEINLFGETVKSTVVGTTYPIEIHDGVPTDHGTILYINNAGKTVTNFPTSATNPNAPRANTAVQYNRIVEVSAQNGAFSNIWSLIDMLNPTRINYLTFSIHTALGWDCEHANAVIEDPRDHCLVVSMRHQDAVVKFTRSGQLKWILGPHENWGPAFQQYLLTPVGSPFVWNYAQHAPMITPQGTWLIFDDGNFRAEPFATSVADTNNYSRAVEYDINEETMEVSQVWDYGRTQSTRLYTDRVGNADWLPRTGNVLINFGNVDYINGARPSRYSTNAAMLRIQEVTYGENPEVVFDLAAFNFTNTSSTYKGAFAYRSRRIPDLYGHLPKPVEDLRLNCQEGTCDIHFSADPHRTYVLEASEDLADWSEVTTFESNETGEYKYSDITTPGAPPKYYRVVTK